MKFGINLTKSADIHLAKTLFDAGYIQYCEILVDNFWLWSPQDLRGQLGSIPVSLHVMHTAALECSDQKLETISNRLKFFADSLNPLYVSDHLARFSAEGRPLPILQEADYNSESEKILEVLSRYQRMFGSQILFENFPSLFESGKEQVSFFENAAKEADIRPLFDISNAVVSRLNHVTHEDEWLNLARKVKHFHVGGFREAQDEKSIIIDSHDSPVAHEAVHFLKRCTSARPDLSQCTLTIEWDQNISEQNFKADIDMIRKELRCY